ncbi:hypothetical protein HOLleu_00661 [Holothuria leucospilota]|uniref:HIN-200 domain-containing protein n=1 Tax=Holothuria leucospilota TaxID=206669 RepID=A0A9Q1CNC5_HOLLE|nr:hypothetical protein HOLleu_00661 [Holothuria leucospilota]
MTLTHSNRSYTGKFAGCYILYVTFCEMQKSVLLQFTMDIISSAFDPPKFSPNACDTQETISLFPGKLVTLRAFKSSGSRTMRSTTEAEFKQVAEDLQLFGKIISLRIPRARQQTVVFIKKSPAEIGDDHWTTQITKDAFTTQFEKPMDMKLTDNIKQRLKDLEESEGNEIVSVFKTEGQAFAPLFPNGKSTLSDERQEDTDEIWMSNLVDKYLERPKRLQHVCMATFASEYRYTGKQTTVKRDLVLGGAGTGKSQLIKCITYHLQKCFCKLADSPDDITVLLIAYTGTAAFNINGQTIHSAFNIFSPSLPYKPLAEQHLNTLQMQKVTDILNSSSTNPYNPPIKVVLATRSEKITYKKDGTDKDMMYLALCDSTGHIKATLYDLSKVEAFSNGSTIMVRNYLVRNDHTIAITSKSQIFKSSPLQVPDAVMQQAVCSVRPPTPPPIPLKEVHSSPVKTMTSVQGMVSQDELPKQVTVRGEQVPVRTIVLSDRDTAVKVSLWRDESSADIQSGDYVSLTNLMKTEPPTEQTTQTIVAYSLNNESTVQLLLANDQTVLVKITYLQTVLNADFEDWQTVLEAIIPFEAEISVKKGELVSLVIQDSSSTDSA